mmetsp:Transcript_75313/g.147806  ORF Transcript_75313/g.147806 Transcript_75313/m.147806 type:complete len:152 (+) Transcript_75313:98-553(+)
MFMCCCADDSSQPIVETDSHSEVPGEGLRAAAVVAVPAVDSTRSASPKAAEAPPKGREDGTFHIQVEAKPGDKIGLDAAGIGTKMRVKAIAAGIIKDWNDRNPKEALQVGDLIVSVNGVEGDASMATNKHLPLLRVLQQKGHLDILVLRQA